jgi:hypothetical protein
MRESKARKGLQCHRWMDGNIKEDFFSVTLRPNASHDLLILDVARSHTTTQHSR